MLASSYTMYIPALYAQSEAIYSFLQAFKGLYCVGFAENVSFGRYGTLFACHDDHSSDLALSQQEAHQYDILDTIINDIYYMNCYNYRSDDYL